MDPHSGSGSVDQDQVEGRTRLGSDDLIGGGSQMSVQPREDTATARPISGWRCTEYFNTFHVENKACTTQTVRVVTIIFHNLCFVVLVFSYTVFLSSEIHFCNWT